LFIRIIREDSAYQLALFHIVRNNGGVTSTIAEEILLQIKPQLSLTRLVIRAVAMKTDVRQDRADVTGEVHIRTCCMALAVIGLFSALCERCRRIRGV
jgi:hypothetical protein